MTKVRFIDLKTQQQRIRPSVDAAIKKVLDSGQYIMGEEVFELERCLAEYVGVKHCVSAASGTDALLMALMAYGVGPGDAIFTSPFTFIATVEVVSLLGATPVFVDIDPKTYNLDPLKLEEAIAGLNAVDSGPENCGRLHPKGIIPVDLFGLPADYDVINSIACDHGLFVLEDAAQSFGGDYKGRRTGSLGDVAATSFFPTKPLGCYGDGGAVFTDNDALAELLRSIRVHGKGNDKYDNVRIGVNGRLDTIQAAILLEKMRIFPGELIERQRIAGYYNDKLVEFDRLQIVVPYVPQDCQSAWAQYSILISNRDELQTKMAEQGVPTAIYYPKPLHLQQAYSLYGGCLGSFPVSEEISQRIISLPMHPYLNDTDFNRIFSAFQMMC